MRMPDNGSAGGMRRMVRALQYRNYRLFFAGQAVSLIGTWMQAIATGWLVYRLTQSEVLLGLVTFAGQVPALFATPFGGVVADRGNRRRMLMVTQALSMVQALTLTGLFYSRTINVEWIIALTALLGLINAFDIPIRHSFVLEMVEQKDDLGNAIALNSSLFNSARLIGPSLAGLLVAATGEGICFLINAVSYLGVIAALGAMKIRPAEKKISQGPVLRGLKEGLLYVAGFPAIGTILLLLCLICLVPYTVLLPVFAKKVLGGGPDAYGFLVGASGLGALLGAFFLASRSSVRGLEKVIAVGGMIFGAGLSALAFLNVLSLALAAAVVIGFGLMITMASSNTVLQSICDDDKRGRVMSFYTLTFMGTAPAGSLLGGFLAGSFSVASTYLVSGLCCLVGATVFALKLPSRFGTVGETPVPREE